MRAEARGGGAWEAILCPLTLVGVVLAAYRPLLDHDERFSDAVVVPEAGATEGTFLVEEVVHDLTPTSRYVHRDQASALSSVMAPDE